MRIVRMSMMARLGLENVLAEVKGTRDENAVYHAIRKKIKVSREDRAKFFRPLGDGRSLVDEEGIENAPDKEVQLETEEVRKLKRFFEENKLPVAMMDWIEPLMEQLESRETGLRVAEAG